MDPHSLGQTSAVVAIADPELLDQVLSVTAVVGVEPLVLSEPGQLRPHWASASMLLVGVDQADRVAAMGLPRRTEVYLVAGETSPADAQQWSIRLGAAVIALPSSVAWLSEALADVAGTGRVTLRGGRFRRSRRFDPSGGARICCGSCCAAHDAD